MNGAGHAEMDAESCACIARREGASAWNSHAAMSVREEVRSALPLESVVGPILRKALGEHDEFTMSGEKAFFTFVVCTIALSMHSANVAVNAQSVSRNVISQGSFFERLPAPTPALMARMAPIVDASEVQYSLMLGADKFHLLRRIASQ